MVSVNYNRWGAVLADVVALYTGTQDADYGQAAGVADATAGQTAINAALDRYSRLAATALTPSVYQQILTPTAELIIDEATSGQATAQLGLFPVVAGSVHLFRYGSWPLDRPRITSGSPSAFEIEPSEYSVTASTGAISLSGLTSALVANELVFASYEVDTTDANFALESLADVVVRGAAADLGRRLYTQGESVWGLVDAYQAAWDAFLEDARKGLWVPDELRHLRWWEEVEASDGWGSVAIGRG